MNQQLPKGDIKMNNNICPKCEIELSEESNYCPICGEPITKLAMQREALKMQNAGLLKLQELSKSTKDPAVLNAIKDLLHNS